MAFATLGLRTSWAVLGLALVLGCGLENASSNDGVVADGG
jgi:hypothetical protein